MLFAEIIVVLGSDWIFKTKRYGGLFASAILISHVPLPPDSLHFEGWGKPWMGAAS